MDDDDLLPQVEAPAPVEPEVPNETPDEDAALTDESAPEAVIVAEPMPMAKGITYIEKYKKYHVEQPGTKIYLGMFNDLGSAERALSTYKA